jgi:hypothetical protein
MFGALLLTLCLLLAYKISRWAVRRERPELLDDERPPQATPEELAELEDKLRAEMSTESGPSSKQH